MKDQKVPKSEVVNGTRVIFCVVCGEPRQVLSSNWKQVKRCYKHQYQEKRRYNTEYRRRTRRAKKEKKLTEGVEHAPLL